MFTKSRENSVMSKCSNKNKWVYQTGAALMLGLLLGGCNHKASEPKQEASAPKQEASAQGTTVQTTDSSDIQLQQINNTLDDIADNQRDQLYQDQRRDAQNEKTKKNIQKKIKEIKNDDNLQQDIADKAEEIQNNEQLQAEIAQKQQEIQDNEQLQAEIAKKKQEIQDNEALQQQIEQAKQQAASNEQLQDLKQSIQKRK